MNEGKLNKKELMKAIDRHTFCRNNAEVGSPIYMNVSSRREKLNSKLEEINMIKKQKENSIKWLNANNFFVWYIVSLLLVGMVAVLAIKLHGVA
jgi:UDP-N-acetylenolpyruvoylglucosamine reductase